MSFIEFKSVFMEPEAPEVNTLCRVESIDLIEINTAGDDTENTGDYYVWFTLKSGNMVAYHRGTLDECNAEYKKIRENCQLVDLPRTDGVG